MMELKKLEYERSWENSADFPTFQDSETQVRADMQYHPNVIRDHINEMVDELTNSVGAPGGIASLDEEGKVPEESIPAMFAKGEPGGVAELDETGKVPESQLPASYVGMESFNGRSGKVLPEKGDYTDEQITASHETAELFGLEEGATVPDAFAAVGEAIGALGDAPLIKRFPRYQEVSIGYLQTGTVVTLEENGAPMEFVILRQDYESTINNGARTLLVRKYLTSEQMPFASTPVTGSKYNYAGGEVDTWLNEEYLSRFSSEVQAAIGSTEIYVYDTTTSKATTISRPVFALSATECGRTSSSSAPFIVLGASTSYSNSIAPYVEGTTSAGQFWTRTGSTSVTQAISKYSSSDSVSAENTTVSRYVLPAFTLPASYGRFYVNNSGVIQDAQEYDYDLFNARGECVGAHKVGDVKVSGVINRDQRFAVCNGATANGMHYPGLWDAMSPVTPAVNGISYATGMWNTSSLRVSMYGLATDGDIFVAAGYSNGSPGEYAYDYPTIIVSRKMAGGYRWTARIPTQLLPEKRGRLTGIVLHKGVWSAIGYYYDSGNTSRDTYLAPCLFTATDPMGEWKETQLYHTQLEPTSIMTNGETLLVTARAYGGTPYVLYANEADGEWTVRQVSTEKAYVAAASYVDGVWVLSGNKTSAGNTTMRLFSTADLSADWSVLDYTISSGYSSIYPYACYYHAGVFFVVCRVADTGQVARARVLYTKDKGETWKLNSLNTYTDKPIPSVRIGDTWYIVVSVYSSDGKGTINYYKATDPTGSWSSGAFTDTPKTSPGLQSVNSITSFGDKFACISVDSNYANYLSSNVFVTLPSVDSAPLRYYIKVKEAEPC